MSDNYTIDEWNKLGKETTGFCFWFGNKSNKSNKSNKNKNNNEKNNNNNN